MLGKDLSGKGLEYYEPPGDNTGSKPNGRLSLLGSAVGADLDLGGSNSSDIHKSLYFRGNQFES